MSMNIRNIQDDKQKMIITREILESLPEWFEIPEGRENYIKDSVGKEFVSAYKDNEPIGFLYLTKTGKNTLELAVMGVKKEYHRMGIGRKLFENAREIARKAGFSFIQVKTVKMGTYADYDKTNLFYLSLGFKELEVFPTLWDEANPCQIYIMSI